MASLAEVIDRPGHADETAHEVSWVVASEVGVPTVLVAYTIASTNPTTKIEQRMTTRMLLRYTRGRPSLHAYVLCPLKEERGKSRTVHGALNTIMASPCMVSRRPRGLKRILPYEERVRLYEAVLSMKTDPVSPSDILHRIESSFGAKVELRTIKDWIAGTYSPYGRVYQMPREPIPELAYLMDVNFGDTSRSMNWHHNYTIRLRVKDEDFAREFARAASVVLGKPCKTWFDDKRGLWQSDVISMLLYELVTKPLSKLKAIITHCEDCIAAFIRGFFDAEGSAAGSLVASNGNLPLLKYVCHLLSSYFGIETTGPHKRGPPPGTAVMIKGRWVMVNHQNYQIRVRNSSLVDFEKKIGFSIVRKAESLRYMVNHLKKS